MCTAVHLNNPNHAAMVGSPMFVKYLLGKAMLSAAFLLKRQGPCADFAVFQAKNLSTPAFLSIR